MLLLSSTLAKNKSKYEKDVINVDRRVNLLYSAITGDVLRIFPVPNDPNYTWVSHNQISSYKFSGQDSVFVRQILPIYIQTLDKAKTENNYLSLALPQMWISASLFLTHVCGKSKTIENDWVTVINLFSTQRYSGPRLLNVFCAPLKILKLKILRNRIRTKNEC